MACAWASVVVTPPISFASFRCRAGAEAEGPLESHSWQTNQKKKKKVVVVGSGWAALASAHHLTKQGIDVTVLDAGNCHDGEAGVGGNGFWFPYQNIYSLIDELGIKPFTKWATSALYSPDGMEAELPVFQDLPRLPAPVGAFLYPQFIRLPLVDRLTTLPLIAAVVDFDNMDTAWRKYDAMTARELFKQFGCSDMLFRTVFDPMLQVGLLAPAEQCSAAATLGLLYYFVLAHQQNIDVRWCRGTVWDKIFKPWQDYMKVNGCKFHENKRVVDFLHNEDTGCVSGVVYGEDVYEADAVVLAVGISTLESIITGSSFLQTKQEFLNVLNLSAIDVLSVKLWMDRKVDIPKMSNICYGFDDLTAWAFFDLNAIYDEHEDEPSTVINAYFHHANQLLPLKDEQIAAKLLSYLSKCIEGFEKCTILQQVVSRFPKSATHFFPGSYKYMMRVSTTIPNLVMAGDWIVTRHGSWSQEKAYVTGLEAANSVVDYLGEGDFAKIISVEEEESHIETLRSLNRRVNEIRDQNPLSDFLLQ